ncbi:hypothetical protein D6853_05590 [Butyrivibrio sp. X503]|uniref:hypothetical protein n=1 Tax=Butyrivibrio sp. X503 TaxID=2364878 RepID=UPI000EA92DE1|nr:hypothetical protein [Butyrivibrio sp. X503]RKM56267.1 hypothetical protein D6853_05590 [Butyrivibrio sp. X503]
MTDGREDLIYSLAKSMGVGDAQKNRVSSGKYNSETGTMYCNGHVISRASIEQAKAYFTTQYKKLAEKDDEGSKELASIYEVAMESINMLVTPAEANE